MTARWLTLTEAAERLQHISADTLYRLNREGLLPTRRVGRKIVISEKNLDAWAELTEAEFQALRKEAS